MVVLNGCWVCHTLVQRLHLSVLNTGNVLGSMHPWLAPLAGQAVQAAATDVTRTDWAGDSGRDCGALLNRLQQTLLQLQGGMGEHVRPARGGWILVAVVCGSAASAARVQQQQHVCAFPSWPQQQVVSGSLW